MPPPGRWLSGGIAVRLILRYISATLGGAGWLGGQNPTHARSLRHKAARKYLPWSVWYARVIIGSERPGRMDAPIPYGAFGWRARFISAPVAPRARRLISPRIRMFPSISSRETTRSFSREPLWKFPIKKPSKSSTLSPRKIRDAPYNNAAKVLVTASNRALSSLGFKFPHKRHPLGIPQANPPGQRSEAKLLVLF